jgi:hypothetical protein
MRLLELGGIPFHLRRREDGRKLLPSIIMLRYWHAQKSTQISTMFPRRYLGIWETASSSSRVCLKNYEINVSFLRVHPGEASPCPCHLVPVLIFLGPSYTSDPVFNLSAMQPYSLEAIFKPFSEATKDIALFLPRTSDLQQIADVVPDDEKIDVIQYCVRGATKV